MSCHSLWVTGFPGSSRVCVTLTPYTVSLIKSLPLLHKLISSEILLSVKATSSGLASVNSQNFLRASWGATKKLHLLYRVPQNVYMTIISARASWEGLTSFWGPQIWNGSVGAGTHYGESPALDGSQLMLNGSRAGRRCFKVILRSNLWAEPNTA